MPGHTVNVVLRMKPRTEDIVSDEITVIDNEQGATVLLKKDSSSGELFQYAFSRALEKASQEEFFKICGNDIVDACLDGYNGTILAYGQTGSGKTYTMLGPEGADLKNLESQGIIPRAIKRVFNGCKRSKFITSTIKMTYVEVYNEAFNDLLRSSKETITVIDSGPKNSGTTALKGCSPMVIKSDSEAMDLLLRGQKSRKVASHSMNSRSSRSHTVLTLWIETTSNEGKTYRSKLNLVDLAGSERLNKTGASGATAKEATYINKSLSCLAMVVKELKKKSGHVRYRDSKLTHYLKDSLGGNCRTLMVACIWGDQDHMHETLSTCRFAEEIQQVEVNAEKNNGMDSVHGNLFKLNPAMIKYIDQMTAMKVEQEKRKLFKELKRRGMLDTLGDDNLIGDIDTEEQDELELLRTRVKELESAEANNLDDQDPNSQSNSEEVETLKKRVADLEEERQKIQAEMASQMQEAECALFSEIKCLREKVYDLQRFKMLSKSENIELQSLREKMKEINERKRMQSTLDGIPDRKYRTWHPDHTNLISVEDIKEDDDYYDQDINDDMQGLQISLQFTETNDGISNIIEEQQEHHNQQSNLKKSITTKNENDGQASLFEQAQILEELEVMRDRLKSLHSVAVEKLNQESLDELAAIKEKIIDLQNTEQTQKQHSINSRDRKQSLSNSSTPYDDHMRDIHSPEEEHNQYFTESAFHLDNLQSQQPLTTAVASNNLVGITSTCSNNNNNNIHCNQPSNTWENNKRELNYHNYHNHQHHQQRQHSIDQDGLLTFRSAYTIPRVQTPKRRHHPEFPMMEFDRNILPHNFKDNSMMMTGDCCYQNESVLRTDDNQMMTMMQHNHQNQHSQPFENSWYTQNCEDLYTNDMAQSDFDSTASAPDYYSNTNYHVYSPSPINNYEKKQSFGKKLSMKLSKLMSFRKPQSYEVEDNASKENPDENPLNIVILNSLTHDQLMEMLKARHAAMPSYERIGSLDNMESPYLYGSYSQMNTWLKEIPPTEMALDPSTAPSPLPVDPMDGKW